MPRSGEVGTLCHTARDPPAAAPVLPTHPRKVLIHGLESPAGTKLSPRTLWSQWERGLYHLRCRRGKGVPILAQLAPHKETQRDKETQISPCFDYGRTSLTSLTGNRGLSLELPHAPTQQDTAHITGYINQTSFLTSALSAAHDTDTFTSSST